MQTLKYYSVMTQPSQLSRNSASKESRPTLDILRSGEGLTLCFLLL